MMPRAVLGLIERARQSVEAAEDALTRGNLAIAVTESQQAVELSLKAVLRAVGLGAGRQHDPGEILRARSKRLPEWVRLRVPEWARISGLLANLRAVSVYPGPEDPDTHEPATIPSERFSDRAEVERIVEMARTVYGEVRESLRTSDAA